MGQHFLKSERALKMIVEAGEVKSGETILEIGPGTGTLTEALLKTDAHVIAVEKDDKLFELLTQKFEEEISLEKLILIHDDILEFDLSKLAAKTYKLIANIPYNITGAILKKFLSAPSQPKLIVLLVQKEVAERIIGTPLGNLVSKWRKESILSISVKVYGEPRYVETVKAGSFAPAPKVDSAIIAIENISKDFFKRDFPGNISEDEFFRMLRASFKSKRKKLSSNLSTIIDLPAGRQGKNKVLKVFQKMGLDENTRAEDVNIETWGRLAALIL